MDPTPDDAIATAIAEIALEVLGSVDDERWRQFLRDFLALAARYGVGLFLQ